ncbi:alpha/beta hydrolase [Undibacterium sp. SXout7W]|uniref:alpha/beta hydrolase n=1 Tax=Undibacterium sp. SXout7W TaxID=3413049 RepID=UPI003BF0226A
MSFVLVNVERINIGSVKKGLFALVATLFMMMLAQSASAGALRDRLLERRAERQEQQDRQVTSEAAAGTTEDAGQNSMSTMDTHQFQGQNLPAGSRVLRDLHYGNDPRQTMDVYLPPATSEPGNKALPVIMMVHGGAWRTGSKNAAHVVQNKLARWLPKGFIFISVNYRMLPDTLPLQQAADVAVALADIQQKAASWGADSTKVILMGHSAGAHLVALLASSPSLLSAHGVVPWLGTVALDSAAYDIDKVMSARHYRFYDQAFGRDPQVWRAASPFWQLTQAGSPVMAVCSSTRPDHPCLQAQAYVSKAQGLGMRAVLLPQAMSHADINHQLGLDNDYTHAVENFMGTLDASVRLRLLH